MKHLSTRSSNVVSLTWSDRHSANSSSSMSDASMLSVSSAIADLLPCDALTTFVVFVVAVLTMVVVSIQPFWFTSDIFYI